MSDHEVMADRSVARMIADARWKRDELDFMLEQIRLSKKQYHEFGRELAIDLLETKVAELEELIEHFDAAPG